MSDFGTRLKQLRIRTGQTQVQLSEALGKSRESVKKYEKGERQPDLESVAKLSKYFNISADYILGITDKVYSPGGNSPEVPLIYHIPEYREFDEYIEKKDFIGYVKLAVKMYANKLNLAYAEEIIDKILKKNP